MLFLSTLQFALKQKVKYSRPKKAKIRRFINLDKFNDTQISKVLHSKNKFP